MPDPDCRAARPRLALPAQDDGQTQRLAVEALGRRKVFGLDHELADTMVSDGHWALLLDRSRALRRQPAHDLGTPEGVAHQRVVRTRRRGTQVCYSLAPSVAALLGELAETLNAAPQAALRR
jgi:hypothetical protein